MKLATYFFVFLVLIITTLLEVALVLRPQPGLSTAPLVMGLGALKALLIALYYQHLKYEPIKVGYIPLISLLPVSALLLALTLTYAGVHE